MAIAGLEAGAVHGSASWAQLGALASVLRDTAAAAARFPEGTVWCPVTGRR